MISPVFNLYIFNIMDSWWYPFTHMVKGTHNNFYLCVFFFSCNWGRIYRPYLLFSGLTVIHHSAHIPPLVCRMQISRSSIPPFILGQAVSFLLYLLPGLGKVALTQPSSHTAHFCVPRFCKAKSWRRWSSLLASGFLGMGESATQQRNKFVRTCANSRDFSESHSYQLFTILLWCLIVHTFYFL